MKLICTVFFVLAFTFYGTAQSKNKQKDELKEELSIESQVADSVCICLSKIDSNQLNVSSNALVSNCLQQGITKNKEAIEKEHKNNRKDESQLLKEGISSSLLIRVQNVLSLNCSSYKKFDKEIQKSRGNTRR